MLFTSIPFIFYFLPLVILLYYLLSFSRLVQNILLFIASIVFYAWGEVEYLILMLISVIVNTILGIIVDKCRHKKTISKLILWITCIYNLGVLFVFKYLNFVVRNINSAIGKEAITIENIILPLGISFFTFQALSYVVDVYRGDAKAEKNPFYVGLYIAFFPQLIAGPIIRYNTVAEQIHIRKSSIKKFSIGCTRFATGFCKKIILANAFALLADTVFNLSKAGTSLYEIPVAMAWLGAIGYTLQIFFDFSAYSDMAIGLGLIFGFEFEENFNYPYISKSIGEFWRRWHISLSTWFKEYVYFPLGGSRVDNQDKMIRNTFVVWLLTGIWHGAEWTFILWGLCNFVFIIMERLFRFEESKIPNGIKHVYTMFVIIIGWVLFRAENLYFARDYIANMFGVNYNSFINDTTVMLIKEYWIFLVAGVLLSTPIAKRFNKLCVEGRMKVVNKCMVIVYPIVLMLLFIICLSYLVIGSYNPFIYFNF